MLHRHLEIFYIIFVFTEERVDTCQILSSVIQQCFISSQVPACPEGLATGTQNTPQNLNPDLWPLHAGQLERKPEVKENIFTKEIL